MRDQLARRLRVLHVREHDHHRSAADAQRHVRHRVPEVRLDVLGLDRVQRFGDTPKLNRAAFGFDEARDPIIERHHADAVAVRLRDPGQHQRGVDGVVELVQVASRRGHEAPAVERDHHLLPALRLDLDDHRAVAPGGRGPAHAPHIVTTHVVAQAGERGRRAGRPRPPHAGHRAEPAPQRELDALDRDDVRKNRDLLRFRQLDLTAPPPVFAPDLQVDGAKPIGASLRRKCAVGQPEPSAGVESACDLTRLRPQPRRSVVRHLGQQACSGSVLDRHRDLFGLAKRERFGGRAPNRVTGPARHEGEVSRRDDHKTGVIDDGDQSEHRRNHGQRDQTRADGDGRDEPGLGREAPNEAQAAHQRLGLIGAARRARLYRGGTTRLATASSTLSGVWPATSASGRRISRWRNAGASSALTWSGVTKSWLSKAAKARAASAQCWTEKPSICRSKSSRLAAVGSPCRRDLVATRSCSTIWKVSSPSSLLMTRPRAPASQRTSSCSGRSSFRGGAGVGTAEISHTATPQAAF